MNTSDHYTGVLLLILVTITATAVCSGQTAPDSIDKDSQYVTLDQQKMRAVIGQILLAEFGRQKGPKRVDIYDPDEPGSGFSDLDVTWLPKVPGINFSLLSGAELQRRGRSGKIDVYFFTKPKIVQGRYQIGFGSGDPFCSYIGSDWTFNMIGAVRVLKMYSGFGAVCCNGSGN